MTKSWLPLANERWAPLGWGRILALGVLLASVAAVAFLDRAVGQSLDLKLLYFVIVLTAGILLPRTLALPLAVGVAVVSGVAAGNTRLALAVDITTQALIYGYATLLTGNWEEERRRLARVSRIDDLTGLYNLRALREHLPMWLGPASRHGRPMTVLMLDIDGFKAVNDRLGHAIGNELLRQVANLLRLSVRIGDALFRFGGDEFVMLLPDTSEEGAEVVARRVLASHAALGRAEPAGGVPVSFSFGIAVFPADGETPKALLTHADEALYAAKRQGGGAICRYVRPQAAA